MTSTWIGAKRGWPGRRRVGRASPLGDYMFERGFEPETLEDWEFGYDSNYDRVTFALSRSPWSAHRLQGSLCRWSPAKVHVHR